MIGSQTGYAVFLQTWQKDTKCVSWIILVQTRFCGVEFLKFGSNTTEKIWIEISKFSVVCESQIQNSTLRRSVFAIKTTTSFHRSLLLCEWRSQIEHLFGFDFGTEVDGIKVSLRPCLCLCICIFAPCICAKMSKYRFHKATARCCNQNCHNNF